MTRVRRRWRNEHEAGTTLVELLVSIMLLAIILAAVSAVYINGTRTQAGARLRTDATNDERIAIETMTKDVRAAVAPDPLDTGITVAKPTELDLYSDIDNEVAGVVGGPQFIRFAFDATHRTIVQTVTPAVANPSGSTYPYAWPASGTRTRTLLTDVTVNPGHPIFTYYAAGDYGPASTPGATPSTLPFNPDGSVTAQDLAAVSSIDIWLTSGANAAYHVPDSVLTTHVNLINTGTASVDNQGQ